jgi:hypothetical protein
MSAVVVLLLVLHRTLTVETSPTPVHDYVFNVTGVVKTAEGTAVQDARITLQLNGAADHGGTPPKTITVSTDRLGGFSFNFFVSRKRGVKYTLTVQKEGFEPATVSGSSPPPQNHVIQLHKMMRPEP